MTPARAAFASIVAVSVLIACNGDFRFDDKAARDADIGEASVGCASDTDCPLASLHCDISEGACVACTSDTQCTAALPDCDAVLQRCVECGSARDCAQGYACEGTTHRCLKTCNTSLDCAKIAGTHCNARGVCVACDDRNEECAGLAGTPVCNVTNGQCVQCARDADCSGAAPRCETSSGKCVACLTARDCAAPTPICDPTTWRCVAP